MTLVRAMAERGRHAEAEREARMASAKLAARCARAGDDVYCQTAVITVAQLDPDRRDATTVGPRAASLMRELCLEHNVRQACRRMAAAHLVGDVVEESRSEMLKYWRRGCSGDCQTPDPMGVLLRETPPSLVDDVLIRELHRVRALHADGHREEGQKLLFVLLENAEWRTSPRPDRDAMWNEVVGLYWEDLVEAPFQRGDAWLAVGRANMLGRAPDFRTRAGELSRTLGLRHFEQAQDLSRPAGSRHFHARLAWHLLWDRPAHGNAKLSDLVTSTGAVLPTTALRYQTSSSHCRHALPPSFPDAAIVVDISFQSCIWSQERSIRKIPQYETTRTGGGTTKTRHTENRVTSYTGCGHDGLRTCSGPVTIETTREVKPATTSRISGYLQVPWIDERIDVRATVSVRGSTTPRLLPQEWTKTLEQEKKRSDRVTAHDQNPEEALPELVKSFVQRELNTAITLRKIEVATALWEQAAGSEDPLVWEDALGATLLQRDRARQSLLDQLAARLGLPSAILERLLTNSPSDPVRRPRIAFLTGDGERSR